ncbi:hypothetical protein BTO32_15340 [Marinobacter lutaoensis]|uniref:Uncharacterized protein n=1 Tax=Marinobacter lutaoensis TaxID=135739 RepID=A0A1V2DPX0_9GAMM|nr:hypothetical protein [Marinobacter lutaoensis]ONF42579.1 hypothetical protein BTO32_15340 [Marinobacter lutaoensis]
MKDPSVISFRAECEKDWLDLQNELDAASINYTVAAQDADMGEPEIELVLGDGFGIEDVFIAMTKVLDGHVMCDTVRPIPLSENSLIRRYNYKEMPDNWMDDE